MKEMFDNPNPTMKTCNLIIFKELFKEQTPENSYWLETTKAVLDKKDWGSDKEARFFKTFAYETMESNLVLYTVYNKWDAHLINHMSDETLKTAGPFLTEDNCSLLNEQRYKIVTDSIQEHKYVTENIKRMLSKY